MKKRISGGRVPGWLDVAVFAIAVSSAQGQIASLQPVAMASPDARMQTAVINPNLVAATIFREIDDPHSGARWLLLRDAGHPAGPGRLVQAALNPTATRLDRDRDRGATAEPASLRPIVHAGDRLIVEEHTTVADAQLEGVALGAAAAGSALNVRLKIGGKIVRAVALAGSRALLVPADEVRP